MAPNEKDPAASGAAPGADEPVDDVARRYALANAVQFGSADVKAVVGKILGERADLRRRARDVTAAAERVVAEVNAMSASARKAALDAMGLPAATKREEKPAGLPALPNATKGAVVLRFAPNPSGPATIGHARGMTIHWEYKRMYDAKLLLRFDDTDATVKRPMLEAYEWIPEDFRWLCGEPDAILSASERMEHYYRHAESAIRAGGAYVCECEAESFRARKAAAEACPHRVEPAESSLAKWERMVAGAYRPGEAVLRIRTQIDHENPALRDWVAFRLARDPHPKVGDRYAAWPLLDFQSAIDDHLTGVTHIIRGKDLRDSTLKQGFLYEHLGWKYPETLYWGRVSVHEFGKFSKSILSEAIARGEYEGWDDPRLPTLRALRRRGFRPEAIRSFWASFGLSEKDVAASIKTLEAENRKVVEPTANRYFFVEDPVEIRVEGAPKLSADAPLHPDHPARGARHHELAADGGAIALLLARSDHGAIGKGSKVRLKDLANVEFESPLAARYAGNDLDFLKQGARIVQWAPPDGVRVALRAPDGETVEGVAEPQLAREKVGAVVQFERVGFARVDEVAPGGVRLYFAHK